MRQTSGDLPAETRRADDGPVVDQLRYLFRHRPPTRGKQIRLQSKQS